jgi:hypothetical protein
MPPIGASGTHVPTEVSHAMLAPESQTSTSSHVGSAPAVLHDITRGPWHANCPSRHVTQPSPSTQTSGKQLSVPVAAPPPSHVIAVVPSQ